MIRALTNLFCIALGEIQSTAKLSLYCKALYTTQQLCGKKDRMKCVTGKSMTNNKYLRAAKTRAKTSSLHHRFGKRIVETFPSTKRHFTALIAPVSMHLSRAETCGLKAGTCRHVPSLIQASHRFCKFAEELVTSRGAEAVDYCAGSAGSALPRIRASAPLRLRASALLLVLPPKI